MVRQLGYHRVQPRPGQPREQCSARGDFGAVQNRLESSISALQVRSENLAAANSRIVDVDVARESDTTLVLFAPGAGDAIQAMKSGLMEVADLWVVNKGDDPAAEVAGLEIRRAERQQPLLLGLEAAAVRPGAALRGQVAAPP